nr:immunoglobulin heavy chain junction region [Macaca mulatta]MPN83927.1 immunoglobulin heavy chain junction region [Macaca mulatta]MPN83937.1 immunoglobulin heavy chain junction region [Macaca mulatta]MPN83946.1 immunoglobulin heavy chain junction region [Macaca mulatta]MPN83985.1 immunoglobulin heavy chain junction region [Macaca mulatta]
CARPGEYCSGIYCYDSGLDSW